MKRTLWFVFATTIVLLAALTVLISAAPQPALAQAPAVDPAVVKDLAPTGTLRIALFISNSNFISKDAKTGELSGIWPPLAKELAARLGIPYQIVEANSIPGANDLAKNGKADIAFGEKPIGLDDPNESAFDTTAAYVNVPIVIIVPKNSPILTRSDLNKPGVRISGLAGASADQIMARDFKQAQFVPMQAGSAFYDALKAGKSDAHEGPISSVLSFMDANPDYRMLSEPFNNNTQVIAIPKGHPEAFAYLKSFVEDVKASGMVQKFIDQSGKKGLTVAPLAVASELAPTGKLLIALFINYSTFVTKDTKTGELSGIWPAMAKELAARLGVPFTIVEYPTIWSMDAVKKGDADIALMLTPFMPAGLTGPDTTGLEFSNSYVDVPVTVMVKANSSIKTLADLNKPGVRIACVKDGTVDIILTRDYKNATIVRTAGGTTTTDAIATGQADAVASPLPGQITFMGTSKDYRILDQYLYTEGTGLLFIVPKGRPASLAYLNAFVEDIKASGWMQRLINQSGKQGIMVSASAH